MLKKYLEHKFDEFQALAWLRAGNPDKIAARCLFELNRLARFMQRNTLREAIYEHKTGVIEIFYDAGLCTSATQELQKFACWHTWEYNNDWEDYCEKCGNTGIYRSYTLYRFEFKVDGQRYIWHQPERLVHWPVRLDSPDLGEYSDRRSSGYYSPLIANGKLVNLYLTILNVYLRLHGKKVTPLLSIAGLLHYAGLRIYHRRLAIQNSMAARAFRRRMKHWLPYAFPADGFDDEIPF